MKGLKRKLAGLLSAVLLLSVAVPGAALAETNAADNDDWVTVTIKSAPGGMLNVVNRDSGTYPYQVLPLDRPVRLLKGTELSISEPTILYPDGSFNGLAEMKLNGKTAGWLSLLYGFNVSEDITIAPEFIRIGAEWNEPHETDTERESLRFQTEKGLGAGYRLETPEEASSLQLYDRTTGEKAAGKFQIRWCREYTAAGSRLGDEERFTISEDGVLHFENLEPKTAYAIDYNRLVPDETAPDADRGVGGGMIYLSIGVDIVEPRYPIAEFEDLPGMKAGDAEGPIVVVEDPNERLESVLREAGAFVTGTEVKDWTDADGRVISGRSLAELNGAEFAVDGSGYYPVYAAYRDYQPPKIRKLPVTEDVLDIDTKRSGDESLYLFTESREAISGAFLYEYIDELLDDAWLYLEDGMAVKNRIVRADRNTKWYQTAGTNSLHYPIAPDKDVSGAVYYYLGGDGGLVTEEWVPSSEAGTETDAPVWWYYFGKDGRALMDGSYVVDGKTYRFDEEGRCLFPGWSVKDGKRVFLDASGKAVKNTFARAAGEWYYLDEDGFAAEGGEQTVKLKRSAKWYEVRGDKDSWELQSFQPNKGYKSASVYYLIDETGRLQKNCWNEDKTRYFGADGRAYQNCTAIAEDRTYQFDRDGLAEVLIPVENAKPSKVASGIEKLKLEISAADGNTRHEAEKIVRKEIAWLLPNGYQIASLSDAKRADGKTFQAAEDGRDGYWLYDVKITNNEAEDAATGSEARRSARVATESNAGRFYATAENCRLTIRSDMAEPELPEKVQETLSQIRAQLEGLTLTQDAFRDEAAAKAAIEAAVKAVLPEGYTAVFTYTNYIAPGAAVRMKNAQGGNDGSITATISLSDADENEVSFTKVLTIKAAEGGSEEEPEEKPEEKPEDRPGEEPGDKPDDNPDDGRPNYSSSSGGANGYATNLHAAVLDTKGSWQQDANGWRFVIASTGEYAKDAWHRIDGKWYYFGSNTYALKGWNLIGGKWYYLDETSCAMQTGWHEDAKDGNWYLLNADGSLALGWAELGGKSYFLNNVSAGPTYTQDPQTGTWKFNGSQNLPYGAMLRDTRTPDGYRVGSDGAWDGNERGGER